MKRLIINADDFGYNSDINRGIVRAHREGVLTSTTLMANGIAFADAVRLAHETPGLDLGCHLVLVQGHAVANGKPLPETPKQLLGVLARGGLDVYRELRAQVEKILDAGITLTHLDSHKHTHLVPGVFKVAVRLAREFSIPYVRLPLDATVRFSRLPFGLAGSYYRRIARNNGVLVTDRFLGFRLTGCLTEDALAAELERLREGVTEFMCHPGVLGPELKQSRTRLKESRQRELDALISPRIREVIAARGIRLGPFAKEPGSYS